MTTLRPALALLLFCGCFQPWSLSGLYRCGGGCPQGMVCDDGVCCVPDGDPACPTLVPDSGYCPNAQEPHTWYADQDGDGFGNPAEPRLACSKPLTGAWVDDARDCDDSSAAAHPGGLEICDGRDNNCDGTIDEGQMPQQPYYRDTDGDGYGDPAQSLSACATPPGYAAVSGDCALDDNTRHPGATELCNGLDDDCNGQRDDNVTVGIGAACADAGLGECASGTVVCSAGALRCQSSHVRSVDLCNGLDDDCDGMVDERPDCGGPPDLLATGAAVVGARDTGEFTGLNPPSSCLKALGTAESWNSPVWSGSKATFHVWYAEAPGTDTWDLSQAGESLHLQFATQMFNYNTAEPWTAYNQPFVLLCDEDPSQFSRYRPDPSTLLNGPSPYVDAGMPLNGGAGWILAQAGADLTHVKRVEVVVQPSASSGTPSFNITFDPSTGFKP